MTVAIVPTIKDLRDNKADISGEVFVENYYSTRVGGGGLFVLSSDQTEPDDGCSVIVDAAQHHFVRLVKHNISVTTCGGLADGKSDDTSAIQSAIDLAAKSGYPVELGRGISIISRSLRIPRSVSILGLGRGLSSLRASGKFLMLQWTLPASGGDAFGELRDFTVDCASVASEGILIAGTADARVQNVMVTDCTGPALVLHALQNGRFDQVDLQRSTVLLLLTNGAWNNVFTRLELAEPLPGGYHLLSKNDSRYVELTGVPPTRAAESQFNQYFGFLFEGGKPTNVVRLEDDSGNNAFISGTISAPSVGAQIYISRQSNDNYFGPGVFIQRVGNPTYAIEDYGYQNLFDSSIVGSWHGSFAKVPDYRMLRDLRGGVNINIGSGLQELR